MFAKREQSLIISTLKKVRFSQVDVASKFLNSMVSKNFEFIEYFDDVKLKGKFYVL